MNTVLIILLIAAILATIYTAFSGKNSSLPVGYSEPSKPKPSGTSGISGTKPKPSGTSGISGTKPSGVSGIKGIKKPGRPKKPSGVSGIKGIK